MPHQSIEVRDRSPADDADIVELLNHRGAENPPIEVDTYSQAIVTHSTRLIAISGGSIIAHAQSDPAWWTGEPNTFAVDVCVDRPARGHGAGTALYHALLERLTVPCRLSTWVERGDKPSIRFAERRGFIASGQVIEESRLDVADAQLADASDLRRRLRHEGIVIESLSNHDLTAPFLEALYRVWSDAEGTAPKEDMRRQVLEGPGLTLETIWVALEGEQPVGMAYLKRLSAHAAESDYTTVIGSHQGRGIARALKHESIRWAMSHKIEAIYTSSVLTNRRMLEINHRLGYRPVALKSEMSASLPAG